MRDPDKLPIRERGTRRVNVLIDTPAGSHNKYAEQVQDGRRIRGRGSRRTAEALLERAARAFERERAD